MTHTGAVLELVSAVRTTAAERDHVFVTESAGV